MGTVAPYAKKDTGLGKGFEKLFSPVWDYMLIARGWSIRWGGIEVHAYSLRDEKGYFGEGHSKNGGISRLELGCIASISLC
jgi:hypothetical protein